MEKKLTQKDMFAEAIKLAESNGREDLVKFFQERIDQLNKKASAKKPTKTQEENVAIKAEILEALGAEGVTVSEIMKSVNQSSQKISALLRQMVEEGTVKRDTDKKKALFSRI